MSEKTRYWDDFLNPVLVKEMRQFFHNKFFLSLVGGLLGIQMLMLFIFNLTYSEWKDSSEAGMTFIIIDTVTMYLCVISAAVIKPMYNFIAERSSKELDFSNITLLTPWQIIGGKLASSLVIWGLIAALCLPFMVMAYFFRNVSLQEIVLIFGAGVMPALVLIQGALFCGTMGTKWMMALLVYFAAQAVAPAVIYSLSTFFFNGNAENWTFFWIFQCGWLMLFTLLLAATITMVTPPFSNRMLPLRILLSLLLILVLGALPFAVSLPEDVRILMDFIALGVVGSFALLAVCDRDEPGGRVLAHIPRNKAGKLFHYLFSSNRRGGIVLALLVLVIFGAETVILGFDGSRSILPIAFGIAGFIFFYCEVAILIHRYLKQVPPWIIAFIVAIALGILPLVCAANSNIELSDIITSPFCLLQDGRLSITDYNVWIAPAAAGLLGIIFVADMCTDFKNYKAPEFKSPACGEKVSASAEEKEPL